MFIDCQIRSRIKITDTRNGELAQIVITAGISYKNIRFNHKK